jgi:hypothetical protein
MLIQAKAVLERVSLALQAQAEEIYSLTQPKAEEFGNVLKSNQAYITNFAEEVDFPLFCISFFELSYFPLGSLRSLALVA